MSLCYDVIIEVDQPELQMFECWLAKYQHSVLAISKNRGCGCCVDIFRLEVAENTEVLGIFNNADAATNVELSYGDKKDNIIHEYLR